MFTKGKIISVLDSQFGSTAKGVISGYLSKTYRPDVLMTANARNSSHTVVDGDKKIVFKVLPCGAFYNGFKGYRPLIYIGPGAAFRPEDLFAEMGECGIAMEQVLVHPLASVVTDADIAYENGIANFEGDLYPDVRHDSGTTRHGTTGSGSGAARARKSLRKGLIARDCPDLKAVLLPSIRTFIEGLRNQTALLDGSQGYLLSLYGPFFPSCTSRAVTLAGFFADCDLPPSLIGDVCAVARTYPIRIASKRYFLDGKFLTWEEVLASRANGIEPNEVDANSGGWYQDQCEISWEELSQQAGREITPELTTLTKLPRRIATWSRSSMMDFLAQNQPPHPFGVHLFLTFTNYVGGSTNAFIERSGIANLLDTGKVESLYLSDGPDSGSVKPYSK